jgi:hypothetical protein
VAALASWHGSWNLTWVATVSGALLGLVLTWRIALQLQREPAQ